MAVTARTQAGPTTANRKWWVDVATLAAPTVWVPVTAMTEFTGNLGTVVHTDTSDWEGEGYSSSEAFSGSWGGEGKVRRATITGTPGSYAAGHEILRKAGQVFGAGNRILARIYEMEPDGGPRVEAATGPVNVTWSDDGGAVTAGSMASFTLVGAGKPTSRVHPDSAVVV